MKENSNLISVLNGAGCKKSKHFCKSSSPVIYQNVEFRKMSVTSGSEQRQRSVSGIILQTMSKITKDFGVDSPSVPFAPHIILAAETQTVVTHDMIYFQFDIHSQCISLE